MKRLERRTFLKLVAGGTGSLLIPGSLRYLSPGDAFAAGQTPFPMTEADVGRILAAARAKGAAFAEIYLEHRIVTELRLADGRIDSIQQGVQAGAGVRALHGERTGYAYADTFDVEALVIAAADAAAIAERGGGEPSGVTFTKQAPPKTVRFERSFDDISADERVTWLQEADQAARDYDPAVTQVTVQHSDEMQHFAVINSDGLWIEDRLPMVYFRVNVNAETSAGRGQGAGRHSRRLGAEQMAGGAAIETALEAARMAVVMCGAADAPAGDMPVILGPGGGVLFHEAVGHGLEGDYAMRGTSFYAGKIGESVASSLVSVMDTGRRADLRGSFNVDDEGAVPLENRLIEGGTLRAFLTDRISADALGSVRTGNGRRQSYRHPPLARMSNTLLMSGRDDADAIIRDTRSGIYARALGGGEVDTTSGNFTFGVREAYRIENGKIGAPVRGANLVGNGPEVMRRIDAVGPDLAYWVGSCGKGGQWVPVTCGAPTLRISSMTVGGSA